MQKEALDKRHERSDATRAALLAGAAPLFAERGYSGTTLEAIAEAAGANKALVRYHFGGKQGLYSAVLLEALTEARRLMESVDASKAPPDERLGLFVDAFAELVTTHPYFVFVLIREEMSGGRHLEDGVFEELLQFFGVDTQILRDGIAAGVFRDVDPEAMHLALIGSLEFFLLSQPLRVAREGAAGTAPELARYFQHVKELFLRGLRP
jgi:TetR/AcrR family transcriptional regulator